MQSTVIDRFPPGPPPTRTPWALYRYMKDITSNGVAFVTRRFDTYGDLYFAPLKKPLYVTRHPEHMEEILLARGSDFGKPEGTNVSRQLERFLGKGLLSSNGDHWRRHRRMINPALSRRNIESYADIMVERTMARMETWQDRKKVDVSREMMELTLDVVTRCLFDVSSVHMVEEVAHAMDAFRGSIGGPAFLPWWLPLPAIRNAKEALQTVDRIVYGIIDDRRAESPEKLANRTDLLTSMVLASDPDDPDAKLDRKQLRDEVLTLFLAGHETTSHTLTWAFHLLSQHPEVAARLHAELDEVVEGEAPTLSDLDNLPYLGAVLDETLRLFPTVPVISRMANKDTEIAGYPVASGSEVILWIYCTHHDARWYPDPERFEPERFLGERPRRGAYLPFGHGTRTCVGKHFALMEAKLMLATIASRWRLLAESNTEVVRDMAITLAPKHGLPMRIARRR